MSYIIWRISHCGAGLSTRSWKCVTDDLNIRPLEKTPGPRLSVIEWCIKSFIGLSQRSWAIALHPVSHLTPAQAAPMSLCPPAGMGQRRGFTKKTKGLSDGAACQESFFSIACGLFSETGSRLSYFSRLLLYPPLASSTFPVLLLLILFVVVSKELVSWF